MAQVSSKADLSAITDFMTALKQATGSISEFHTELSKRLIEQGDAVTSLMENIRSGSLGSEKSVKQLIMDKLATPFDFNKILLDLQIDEKLTSKELSEVRQKFRSALAATKGDPAAIAGVFSELLPALKDHSEFDGIVQQVTRGAMAFQLQPAALAKALAQALRLCRLYLFARRQFQGFKIALAFLVIFQIAFFSPILIFFDCLRAHSSFGTTSREIIE